MESCTKRTTTLRVSRKSSAESLLLAAVNCECTDVITAFLNDQLDEDIYMAQPDGFSYAAKPDYVCRLQRSLYDMKQSPRMLNKTIDDFMLGLKFIKRESDHCV